MKPRARSNDLLVREETGELFICDLLNAKAICLNPTSAYVWQKCDGRKEPGDIAHEMGEELGVPVSENLVSLAIHRLSADHLLEFTPRFA